MLRVELTGTARVDVYRSKATGARITVGGEEVSSGPDGDARATVEFDIDLSPFEDGGWIWFDITTNTKVTVHSAGWYAFQARAGTGQRRGRNPHLQPTCGLRQRARRIDVRYRWWTR